MTETKLRIMSAILRVKVFAVISIAVLISVLSARPGFCSTETYLDKEKLLFERDFNVGFDGEGQWLADMDGDGRVDYIYNKSGSPEYRVMLSNGNNFGKESAWGKRKNGVGFDGNGQWLADVNGDGKADYIYNKSDSQEYYVMLSKGDGFKEESLWGKRVNGVGFGGKGQWLADMNGDGKMDYIYNKSKSQDYYVMLSRGDGFREESLWGKRKKGVGFDGKGQWLADVNGDRKTDYIYNKSDSHDYYVMLSKDDGFEAETKWGQRKYGVGFDGKGQWIADMNGDGSADFIYNKSGTREYCVMLSKGIEFKDEAKWGAREIDVVGANWLVDVNGDKMTDYVYTDFGRGGYRLMTSRGNKFNDDTKWGTRSGSFNADSMGGQWLVDVNGDGNADLMFNSATQQCMVMMSKDRKPDGFTMMITADPQYGWGESALSNRTNEAQIKAMNSITEHIGSWPGGDSVKPPLGVIVNGDLTNYYHKDQRNKYETWFEKELNYLVFPGLGNHDYSQNVGDCTCYEGSFSDQISCAFSANIFNKNYCAEQAVTYMKDTLNGGSSYYFGGALVDDYDMESLSYSFNIGMIHFVQLNLNPGYENKNIGIKKSYDWLKKNLLTANRNRMKTVINLHEYGGKFSNDVFGAAIKWRNVIAVFAGHEHDQFFYVGKVENTDIPYFRSGGPVSTDNNKNAVEKFLLVEFTSTYMRVGAIDYTTTPGFAKSTETGEVLVGTYPYPKD